MMCFYSAEQLGPRQVLLPSSKLWLRDVGVARTGTQTYHPDEIDVAGDRRTRLERRPVAAWAG